MKLSDLVGLLHFLESVNLDSTCADLNSQLHSIHSFIDRSLVKVGPVVDDIASSIEKINLSIDDFKSNIQYLVVTIKQAIADMEPHYYTASRMLYEEEMRWETNDYILHRKLVIEADIDKIIHNRIKGYSDWRLPGLIIRPALENHIEELVPMDPLYVVDHHLDLILPSVSKFTEEYQQRLRVYTINDYDNINPLEQLPNNQFGLILAYNYLNYKPMHILERFLEGFYQKLRPGGVVLFTYNNCDNVNSISLTEKKFCCYTPGSKVSAISSDIGFEKLNPSDDMKYLNYMELKKPGEISSLRGGQTFALIKRK